MGRASSRKRHTQQFKHYLFIREEFMLSEEEAEQHLPDGVFFNEPATNTRYKVSLDGLKGKTWIIGNTPIEVLEHLEQFFERARQGEDHSLALAGYTPLQRLMMLSHAEGIMRVHIVEQLDQQVA